MGLTVGTKINLLLVMTLLCSVVGISTMATRLFTEDLQGFIKKDVIDQSAQMAGRVRAEMKLVADRVEILGASSLEDFQYEEDKIRFIQDNLSHDTQYVALSFYRREVLSDGGAGSFVALWRAVNPSYQKALSIKASDLENLDRSFPLDFAAIGKGSVDFSVGKLSDNTPILRMGIPLVKRADGSFSQILVVELQQEKVTSLFSESNIYTNYLLDRRGVVLGSSNPLVAPLGSDQSGLSILSDAKKGAAASTRDFVGGDGQMQQGAYQKVGFGELVVVSQVNLARANGPRAILLRRTFLLGGAILFLALVLGFSFSLSITEPIKDLAAAARRVAGGDLSVRLPAPGKNQSKKDEIRQFSSLFNDMVSGLQERDKVKNIFAKFHSKKLVDKMVQGEVKIGGERKVATVLFSDVRNFTALSEKSDPEVLLKVLNQYLGCMVRIILSHGGFIDKFMGDGILAVWGIPEATHNDSDNAIRACLEIRKALVELNKSFAEQGLPQLSIGMGLNYGPLIVGNIGSEERMEYTVIGDTVNTATRIESLTKMFGIDLLVSDLVIKHSFGKYIIEDSSGHRVKGRTQVVNVYQIHGYQGEHGERVIIPAVPKDRLRGVVPAEQFEASSGTRMITGEDLQGTPDVGANVDGPDTLDLILLDEMTESQKKKAKA